VAFATANDVGQRLGRSLTSAEQTTATSVIATVQALIADEVDRDSDWADALDPAPAALKELCVAKAVAAITNPRAGAVASQTIGEHSITYARGAESGAFLTDAEARVARLAVYGTNTGSSTPRSVVDRLIDLAESRDVDEEPEE